MTSWMAESLSLARGVEVGLAEAATEGGSLVVGADRKDGPESRQPPGLGVDSLRAGGERDRTVLAWPTAAADVDVDVEAVLDHLGVRHHMEPDAGAAALGIDDAVRADSQLTVGKPDVAPPVVPGSEPFGGRFKHVSQGSRPEAGQQLGVRAVDDELESGRHRAPIGSAVAGALASMTPTADTNEEDAPIVLALGCRSHGRNHRRRPACARMRPAAPSPLSIAEFFVLTGVFAKLNSQRV